jgi:Flp pilus assembly protein TadG
LYPIQHGFVERDEKTLVKSRRHDTRRKAIKREGNIAVAVALSLVMIMGFSTLVVDVGNLYLVRNELQNAADAAALAGARHFYPSATSGATASSTPLWSSAELEASTAAPDHTSNNVLITDYETRSGYWDLNNPITSGDLPDRKTNPGANDVPALQVTVRRASGANGGPVRNFFAAILGTPTTDVSATAIAICASPGRMEPGLLLPMVISSAVANQRSTYHDASHVVRIGSSYHYPTSEAGQWTSFDLNSNSSDIIRGLFTTGNPSALGIGDNIWISTGTKATLYSSVPYPRDVVLAVVNDVSSTGSKPIVEFVSFHITNSVGANGKYIEGYFIQDMYVPGSNSVGPYAGIYSPPRLVR